MKEVSEKGIFTTLVKGSSSLNSTASRQLLVTLLKWLYFILSFLVILTSLRYYSSIATYLIIYWAFILLPITEYWVTLSSLSVPRSILTGCHFIFFIGILDRYSLWEPYLIELYAVLFCYYRISLTGLVCINCIVFVLLEYGTIRIVPNPIFSWPLLLHASWANRILHFSRTRLRENLDQLVIMKKRIQLERQLGNKLITDSFGYKVFSQNKPILSNPSVISAAHPQQELVHQCVKSKILSSPNNLSLFQSLHLPLHSPNNVRKQACSLIAFKQIFFDANECVVDSTIHQNIISQLLDFLCKHHRVSMVKKFGDVYIGCIGFFEEEKDWGSPEENITHTIEMACDLFNLGAKDNLHFICAIDYGRIVGGFVENIFAFDMFGPEILWVLSVCESTCARKIILSKSVHLLFAKSKSSFPFHLEEWHLQLPDHKELEKAAAIKNIDQCHIFAASGAAVNKLPFELSRSSVDSPVLPWYIIQQMFVSSKVLEYQAGPQYSEDQKPSRNYLQYFTHFITRPIVHQRAAFVLKKFPDIDLNAAEMDRSFLMDGKTNFFSQSHEENEAEFIFSNFHSILLRSVIGNLLGTLPGYIVSHIRKLFQFPFRPPVSCQNFQSPSFSDDSRSGVQFSIVYNEAILFDAFPPPFVNEWKEIKEYFFTLRRSVSRYLATHLSHYTLTCWNRYLSWFLILEGNLRIIPTSMGTESGDSRCNDSRHDSRNCDSRYGDSRYSLYSQTNKSMVENCKEGGTEDVTINLKDPSTSLPIFVDWTSYKNRCHYPHYRYSDPLIHTVYSILCYTSLAYLYPSERTSHLSLQNIGVYPLAVAVTFVLWCSVVFMEKNHPPIIYVCLIGSKIFITCVFPLHSLDAIHTLLSIFVLWNYFSLSQEIFFYLCDSAFTIAVIWYRMSMIDREAIGVAAPDLMIGFQIFFILYYLIAEFYTYLCYLVEHTLIPYEIQVCQEEIGICRAICGQFTPHIPLSLASELYIPRRYRKCAILAFHIKAAESIPAVVDVGDVTILISFLYSFMDDCVRQFGLLKISHFSGVHISAICEDEIFQSLSHDSSKTSSVVSYIQRAVMCVRYMQTKLKTFNTENSMNLTLGVSLSHGSANIGLLGNTNNLQFDISCRARDNAFYMCVRQTNSLVVSEEFYDEINRLREVSNCVYNILDSKLPSNFLCQTWYNVELNSGYFGAIARELEDYHYVGFLGEGGNGSVHLLVDKISKVQVAVKGIHWGMGRSSSINHIRRELRILQQLQHPNIVNFKFCIIRRAKIYIVMEYIRGGTLRQILAQHDISLDDRKIWFAQLVLALGYLHDHGIMHRDVKPSNCMIDTFGRLKLTDFGLALQEEDTNGTSVHAHKDKDMTYESDAESSLTTNMTSFPKDLVLAVTTRRLLQNIFPMRENHDMINSKVKESILVIDSSKYRLNQNVGLLQQAFTVWSANTDDEAIDLLSNRSNHKIDIILMDLSSNENTTGWGFLSQLWGNEEWKDTPVIILTELHDITFHSQCWKTRLQPGIIQRPKLILNHPFDFQAYRYYFQMLCRLEMTSTTIPDPVVTNRKVIKHGTIFDKMFDKVYQQKEASLKNQQNQSTTNLGENSSSHCKGKIKGSGFVGTIQYMAPEMIVDLHNYTEAVDWWSCGVLIFECLTKKRLFEGSNHSIVTREIVKCDITKKLYQYEDLLDSQSLDLLLNLLEKDPKKRYGEKEIKEHPFFFIQFSTTSQEELTVSSYTSASHSYVGKLKYTSPAVAHQPRHQPRHRDALEEFENDSQGDEESTPPRTCLTLPSHDFENLSASFSKYKPKEKQLDKVSDPLRQKRIQEFYSVDDDPVASTGRSRGSNHNNHHTSSKAMDNSRGKLHLPQLPESKVESEDEQCELESFNDDEY